MQASEDWKVSNYKEEFLKGTLALFEENYPNTDLGRKDFFEWQNFKNPCGNSVIKLAISQTGEVVGYYGVMLQRYWINGKEVLGSVSLNTLVREDFRGRGIFTILARECFEECVKRKISFTLGFPNQNSYHGFVAKLGFIDLGEMPLLIKPYNLLDLLKYKLKILKNREFQKEVAECEKIGILKISGLWREVTDRKKNVADRRESFLSWRLGWPRRCYKVVSLKDQDGKVVAYAVLKVIKMGGLLNGLIADIKIDHKRLDEAKGLMGMIDAYWRETGIDQAGCMLPRGVDEFRFLQKVGYIDCPDFLKPQPIRPVVKWHTGKEPEGFYGNRSWFFTMIDYDIA